MKRWVGAALAAMTLTGCATQGVRAPMQDRITSDIGAFNEAYAQSANNLVLWNVLRARDRLPRNYVAIKEITTSQGRTTEHTWGLESLDLGGDFADDPWGVASLGGSTSLSNEPSYGISPIVADAVNRAVTSPTPPSVFALYWGSWGPQDVLLSVLVDTATPLNRSATDILAMPCLSGRRDQSQATDLQEFVAPAATEQRRQLLNRIDEPDQAGANDPNRAAADGDRFIAFARWVKEHRDRISVSAVELSRCDEFTVISYGGNSGRTLEQALALAAAYRGEGAVRRIAPGRAPNTIEVRPVRASVNTVVMQVAPAADDNAYVGTWELELRSLDQAIYYLGESIRQPTEQGAFDQWVASRHSRSSDGGVAQPDVVPAEYGRLEMVRADCDALTVLAPLFRVRRSEPRRLPMLGGQESAAADERAWQFDRVGPAARVAYRGAIYEAGPPSPINSSCRAETDFSGQVLTLLSQLLASNQSPDALRLPARFTN